MSENKNEFPNPEPKQEKKVKPAEIRYYRTNYPQDWDEVTPDMQEIWIALATCPNYSLVNELTDQDIATGTCNCSMCKKEFAVADKK
jgi:hypothetical protein